MELGPLPGSVLPHSLALPSFTWTLGSIIPLRIVRLFSANQVLSFVFLIVMSCLLIRSFAVLNFSLKNTPTLSLFRFFYFFDVSPDRRSSINRINLRIKCHCSWCRILSWRFHTTFYCFVFFNSIAICLSTTHIHLCDCEKHNFNIYSSTS